jgi:hypothetical protein
MITGSRDGSAIKHGNAIYVIEVPDSDDAPHQAKDLRYYVRISGHNQPAPHWMIEDIRSRRRDPRIDGYICFRFQHAEHLHDRWYRPN